MLTHPVAQRSTLDQRRRLEACARQRSGFCTFNHGLRACYITIPHADQTDIIARTHVTLDVSNNLQSCNIIQNPGHAIRV